MLPTHGGFDPCCVAGLGEMYILHRNTNGNAHNRTLTTETDMTVQTLYAGRALAGNATGLARWIDDIRQAFALHRQYRTILGELDAMTDRELADLNLSRASIRDVAREAVYGRR